MKMLKRPLERKELVELRSRRVIRLGFGLVIIVVCFIVLFGIQRLTIVKDILSSIVSHEQVAIEMLFRMQQSARDRSVLLYSVAATVDPFERDELLLQHGKLGGEFNQAREVLTQLQLDEAEIKFLDSINAHVNQTRLIQAEVIDELAVGRLKVAQKILNKQVVPSQALVVTAINAFLQYEIDKSHRVEQDLRDHQWHAQLLMVIAGVVALLFVVLISMFISRRMGVMILGLAETAHNLEESNHSLEAFKSAMDHHSIVSIADIRGVITFVNDRFCEISGYKKEELIGKNHRILNSAVHSHAFFAQMWATISAGKIWQGEI
jgi:PAS domain-containing protein